MLQHQDIFGDRRAREALLGRRLRRARPASAPSEEKSSAVLRHCSTFTESKVWLSSACTSSVSNGGQRPVVPKVPSRMARPARPAICAELGGIELAELIAVELAVGGEGDVIDIEIEAHADRVGRDQIVDVARLIERDLRVARARRQRAEHDRGAAALAADQFGDRVDLVGRERDDRGAARQARELLLAGESAACDSRGRLTGCSRRAAASRPCGRMVAAPSTSVSSRPRRLSMRSVKTWPRSRSAPSWISSIATNATSRSRGIASTVETQKRGFGGLIFSSPVIERDLLGADPVDALVVDLAREQPQRQPDHAGRMRQHALDGEMGLAGVGRARARR